jgi:transcriptional regulator with XRE-family HTH domain
MRIGLKTAILAAGKSQRQVAAACGIPENRMSDIVRGWTDPRDEERERISTALGRPVDELFERTPVSA